MTLMRTCQTCEGSGRDYWSRYGGNDPDVVDRGPCTNDDCEDGAVPVWCEMYKCNARAVEMVDGTPSCAAHAQEFREEADAA